MIQTCLCRSMSDRPSVDQLFVAFDYPHPRKGVAVLHSLTNIISVAGHELTSSSFFPMTRFEHPCGPLLGPRLPEFILGHIGGP